MTVAAGESGLDSLVSAPVTESDPKEAVAEERPNPDRTEKRIAKIRAKLGDAQRQNEELRREMQAQRDRVAALEARMSAPPIDDFEITEDTDPAKVKEHYKKRLEQERARLVQTTTPDGDEYRRRLESSYNRVKEQHPEVDEYIARHKDWIEADPDRVRKLQDSPNPVHLFYEWAQEREAKMADFRNTDEDDDDDEPRPKKAKQASLRGRTFADDDDDDDSDPARTKFAGIELHHKIFKDNISQKDFQELSREGALIRRARRDRRGI